MRQGFFGVKNCHIALLTAESPLTYAEPVAVPGTVEISADAEVSSEAAYADDMVWIDGTTNNGFSGTLSLRDTVSTPTLRELFAKLSGYAIDANGRILGLTQRAPQTFALMCEKTGTNVNQRRCWYYCQLTPPSFDAATKEDNAEITQLDYEFTARPVTLPSGEVASHYDDFTGSETFDDFFEAVDTAIVEKP